MSSQWYYTEDRQRKGPISEDELKQLRLDGPTQADRPRLEGWDG